MRKYLVSLPGILQFSGEQGSVPIFGLGTATPTPGPSVTPTVGTTPTPVSTITSEQPTLAPTATSIYEGTSAAILAAFPTIKVTLLE